jgi:hypothetical protein
MDIHIPTHVSMAIGEAVLRSIVQDLRTNTQGNEILKKCNISLLETSEDMESVTLNSLLDKILPREDDSETDDDSEDET